MDKLNETVTTEYLGKKLVPAFGQQRLEVDYMMTHTKYHRVNKYLVTCEVAGLMVCDPELLVLSATWQGDMERDSNDETLTEEAAIQLFEDNL
jgi:hypothetical protein